MKTKVMLVTGGRGFMGGNFIRYVFNNADFNGIVINLDKPNYAGKKNSIIDIEREYGGTRLFAEKNDIYNVDNNLYTLEKYNVDTIVHFAAESHVGRSIENPEPFILTNVFGTYALLEAAKIFWNNDKNVLFHHVSTDEVYGSAEGKASFNEETRYNPRNPYSASKAASDHIVMSYHYTFGLPVTVSNSSNNYGPFQYPEKLIPIMVYNILNNKILPVHGDGKDVRDWLHVYDNNRGIWDIINKANAGNKYNIGGETERQNIEVVNKICEAASVKMGYDKDYFKHLIRFVENRPGQDERYSMDNTKIKRDLGWNPQITFEEGLYETVSWYIDNKDWFFNIDKKF